MLARGELRTVVHDTDHVSIDNLASFDVSSVCSLVPESELMKELNDLVESINERSTSIERCRVAYWAYIDSPSEDRLRQLSDSYEATPTHLRYQLLGFEEKDFAIQDILYRRPNE